MTIEDTTGRFQASHGQVGAGGTHLLSEPKIVAGLAKATLAANPTISTGDPGPTIMRCIRDAIAETYPAIFAGFNTRIEDPAGFDRPLPARERRWMTKTGKANFIAPRSLSEDPDLPRCREGVLTLITVRSNDQFNTTIYGYEDRLRGIHGTRMVVLMNKDDMAERGIVDGDDVDLIGNAGDQATRIVPRVARHDL